MREMSQMQRRARGKVLLIWGFTWFTLTFFWLPPLSLILGWFGLPGLFYALLGRSECVASALLAATGAVLWNSAPKQKISIVVSLAAYSLATLAIFTTFNLYGWFQLTR
jgi:hypothetical protein